LRDAEAGKTLVFLTNQFGLPAAAATMTGNGGGSAG